MIHKKNSEELNMSKTHIQTNGSLTKQSHAVRIENKDFRSKQSFRTTKRKNGSTEKAQKTSKLTPGYQTDGSLTKQPHAVEVEDKDFKSKRSFTTTKRKNGSAEKAQKTSKLTPGCQTDGSLTEQSHGVEIKDRNFKGKQSFTATKRKNGSAEKAQKTSKVTPGFQTVHNKLENISTVDQNAKKHISDFHNSIQFTMHQCQICHEAWPLKSKAKSSNYICRRCKADKVTPKKFSAGNYMIPSSVPKELQGLTQIEEMLISRALPIMKVYVKPGGQRGYTGHCINLPQEVTELAQSLPRYPKNISLIVVTMNGKDNSFEDVIVRRNKVEQALHWLMKNNPHYEKIKFDSEALNSLPSNGIPVDLQTIKSNDTKECDEPIANDNYCDDDNDEQLFDDNTETSSFLPQNENVQLEDAAIQTQIASKKIKWPTVSNNPLNEYITPFLATLAFPTLFPDGKGDPTNPSLHRDVSFISCIQHLLKFAESINGKMYFRFASHPRFSYWALNLIQRKRTLQQTNVF